MPKSNPIEDAKINEHNKLVFKRYNVYGKYNCCLCKRAVYADESSSNNGDRLICETCKRDNFKTTKEAREWMNRGKVYE